MNAPEPTPTSQLRLAGCIIQNSGGAVLLLHRNTPRRTQWEIPGGKIDAGESAADAMVRELKEEVIVDVSIVRELGAKEFREDDYIMHYTWFLGEVVAGTPAIGEPDKFDDLRYFTRAELEALHTELSPNTRNFLDAWTSGEFTLS